MGLIGRMCAAATLLYIASTGAASSDDAALRPASESRVDLQLYRVSGPDLASVVRQVAGQDSLAGGHLGMASYQLSWQLQTRPTAAYCELVQAGVIADIRIRVPDWVDRAGAPAREQQQWDRLIRGMFEYEERHRKILRESASQLGARLVQLPRMHDCAVLQEQAWQQGQQMLASTGERFALLQQQTEQGRKLGLAWPEMQ